MGDTKNGKRKGKLILKNEEISERKAHANTWKKWLNREGRNDIYLQTATEHRET